LQAQNPLSQKVPIECFQVTEIKNDSMSFGNRPLVERVGADNVKNLFRSKASFGQTLEQLVPNFDFLLRDGHPCLQSPIDSVRSGLLLLRRIGNRKWRRDFQP